MTGDDPAIKAWLAAYDSASLPDAVKAHQAECGRCKYLTLASDPRDWCPDGAALLLSNRKD